MTDLPHGPSSRIEAYSMLAHHALTQVWYASDFQPRDEGDDIWGCCPGCCAPCGALLYLDRQGVLEPLLREWEEGLKFSTHVDGKLDREWLYRQWDGSPVQEQCGHRVEMPTFSDRKPPTVSGGGVMTFSPAGRVFLNNGREVPVQVNDDGSFTIPDGAVGVVDVEWVDVRP